MTIRNTLFISFYIVLAILEAIFGMLFLYPFINFAEKPEVSYVDTPLNKSIVSKLSPLIESFTPAPWALGAASQTIFSSFYYRNYHQYTSSELILSTDGVQLCLHYKEKPNLSQNAPIVLICTGIGGCADSCTSKALSSEMFKLNWRSIVYTRRGHGRSSSLIPVNTKDILSSKGFPSHCDLDDLENVVDHIMRKFPDAPKNIVGFSAGANLVVKYLAVCNKNRPCFKAGVSVCNGHDLVQLTHDFEKRPIANALMTNALQNMLRLRLNDMKAISREKQLGIDFIDLLSTSSVREFETKLMLPQNPKFKTIDEYYANNSCHTSFENITIPLLSLASKDDPLIHPYLIQYAKEASKKNPNVISICTKQGGHLGWLTGWSGHWWMIDTIVAFLQVA